MSNYLHELEYQFYGGGNEAKAQFLRNAQAQGLTAAEMLGPAELLSVEKADAAFTSTVIAGADITGVAGNVTVAVRPAYVIFGASDMSTTAASGLMVLQCLVDGVAKQFIRGNVPGAGLRIPIGMQMLRLSTPGTYALKLQVVATVAGTMTVYAGAGGPIFLRAFQA